MSTIYKIYIHILIGVYARIIAKKYKLWYKTVKHTNSTPLEFTPTRGSMRERETIFF
jgi:hypothetical protein